MAECINCGGEADGEYTLVVPAGVLLQNEPLCATCQTLFEGSDQFEVHPAPVLLRGGDDEGPDPDERDRALKRS